MKIYYFAPVPFNWIKQRPQHIAEELSKNHKVIYVEPTISGIRHIIKGGPNCYSFEEKITDNLTRMRIDGSYLLPRSMEAIFSGFNFRESRTIKKLTQNADIVWIGYAPWYSVIKTIQGVLVYDKMDDDMRLTKNKLMQKLICKSEAKLIRRADIMFVTAKQFYDEAIIKGGKPILLPNAIQYESLKNICTPIYQKKRGTRIFGYVGMISHWFDFNAIKTILDADSKNIIILVGPVGCEKINNSRVKYIGKVPHEQVGAWIASFDVCLYTFKKDYLLDSINPVKIYEYLSQNKPIIAVSSREIVAFKDKIYTYRNSEELSYLAKNELMAPFKSEETRNKFIINNTWEARNNIIEKNILNLFGNNK